MHAEDSNPVDGTSQGNADVVASKVVNIEIVDAEYVPTSNDVLCNMRCERCCLQHDHSKKFF